MSFLARFVQVGSEKSEWLLLVGIYYVFFGAANIFIPETATKSRIFGWMPTELDANEFGWVWLIVGVYIVLSILFRREPPKHLTGPITWATIPPTIWAIIFFVAAFGYGVWTALSGGLTYLFIAASIIMISGHLDHLFYKAKKRKQWRG